MWTVLLKSLQGLARTVGGIAAEIADQRAYERHLRIQGVPHSGEEWRRFSDARLRAKFVRPKCC
jgi:hypothetical protein